MFHIINSQKYYLTKIIKIVKIAKINNIAIIDKIQILLKILYKIKNYNYLK